MTDPLRPVFRVVAPRDWDGVIRFARTHLHGCLFRGQSDASRPLSTSLHRVAGQGTIHPTHIPAVEREMLMQFLRRAHHYIPAPPPQGNRLEWLALMQHYGAPTRLLDFTHSFYVAAFFALETAGADAAVWAVRWADLNAAVLKTLPGTAYTTLAEQGQRYADLANQFLDGKPGTGLVFDVEPRRMNERLSIQQGIFLFPADVTASFEANLAATFGVEPELFRARSDQELMPADVSDEATEFPAAITKLIIADGLRQSGLADLVRMNITAATLFPGLDGYARSLRSEVQLWTYYRPHLAHHPP